MHGWQIALLVILIVMIVAMIVLYFLGKRAQKKKEEQDAQLAAAAQTVTMLIIDKKNDVVTLRNLGANERQIVRVFLFEGRMISAIGAVAGIVVGLTLCWLQQEYGLVGLGSSSGSFVVDAYPVSVHPEDIFVVFATVICVGWLAVWYAVRYFSKRLL